MTTPNKSERTARESQILAAALKLAVTHGYRSVTRDHIGQAIGVSPTLVSYVFKTMPNLRRDIMREAVRTENLRVLAQGLAMRDPHARKASPELRQRAAQTLA